MAKQLMPKAELEVRESDVHLTNEQFLQLSLFSRLKRKPNLDKFPGALVLRRYRKDEVIFRQGEPGWTAFYILTTEDILNLRRSQLETAKKENVRRALQYEIALLEERQGKLASAEEEDSIRNLATVYLAVARTPRAQKSNIAKRLLNFKRRPTEGSTRNLEGKTLYIPVDGPVTLNYDSLRASLQEGELFGEMSCLYRTPRSATVRVDRDCYMIEMLRNILDGVQRDPVYKKQADEVYKKRILELQLRKLSIFSELTDEEFQQIREAIELVTFEPGQLICDEHERSDSMYIVRSGLVKVIKNVTWLLGQDDVIDWGEMIDRFKEVQQSPETPLGKLWALIPKATQQQLLAVTDPNQMTPPQQLEILYSLNDVLKSPRLPDVAEMKSITESEPFQQHLKGFPDKRKLWNDSQVRKHNRLLLEALLPKAIRKRQRYAAPESILTYRSRGEYFGEMGLMLNRPRNATCVAYGHPNDYGQVELVRLSDASFKKLMNMSSTIRDNVKKEIATRRKETMVRLTTPVWDDSNQVQFSEQFEALGLIQGQQLMLIDLDRCTRCDECVQACVNTHDDGRSRLFLDGPRFGRYLIPTSCRSCLDPVCLIGCPVGSIHRGKNREIIIEDWCIGCSACADSCPYGSIQMHDLGAIPFNARGWRFLPAAQVGTEEWTKRRFRDSKWLVGTSPFTWNRDMQALVLESPDNQSFCFRYDFALSRKQVKTPGMQYRIELVAMGADARVWLNGHELQMEGKPKRGRREYFIPPHPVEASEQKSLTSRSLTDYLYSGHNVVAVEVESPAKKQNEVLMQLRLDEVRRPKDLPEEVDEKVVEEVTEKLVTHRAVVCDLCSTTRSKIPACVHACPHDAAMRVDSRSEFPMK